MNSRVTEHPDPQVLTAFGLGRLEAAEAKDVETHVARCEICCETLLDLQSDTFIDLVRRADAVEIGAAAPGAGVADGTAAYTGLADEAADELPAELTGHARYRILELLGRGGMGDVYKAEHRLMDRQVALKLIKPRLVDRPEAVERFRREVRAAARLSHPNIVTAYDAEQAGDMHFLVMEFVAGTELSEIVNQQGPLPVGDACDYVMQAATALHHAYEAGMVHRDIKPHNLMLTDAGDVKVLDFGLANFANESAVEEIAGESRVEPGTEPDASAHLTEIGAMMGTPDYISPEQARNARAADIRSDIYSLGCTLYCLLAGEAPFSSASVLDKLQAHKQRQPRPLHELRDDLPPGLEEVLGKMMAKDPAARFQTPAEASAALAEVVVGRSTEASQRGDGRFIVEYAARFCVGALFAAVIAVGLLQLGLRAPTAQLTAVTGVLFAWGCTHWLKTASHVKRTARAGVGLLTAVGVVAAFLVTIVTDRGLVEIHSEAGDVRVVVSQGGKEVRVFDVERGTSLHWLPTGDYELAAGGDSEATLTVGPSAVTLRRLGKEIVRIEPATLQSDRDLIQGTWVAEAGERGGTPLPIEQVGLQRAVFGEETLSVTMPGELAGSGFFRLDASQNPKQIWVLVEGQNRGSRGIYELEGDQLKVCMDLDPAKPAPTTFTTGADNTYDLVVLRRVPSGDATPVERELASAGSAPTENLADATSQRGSASKKQPTNEFTSHVLVGVAANKGVSKVFFGMKASEVRRRDKHLGSQGFRLAQLSGHAIGGQARYAAIWKQSSGPQPQQEILLDATQAGFQEAFDRLTGQGFRLARISGFAPDDEPRYAAVFEQGSGLVWQARMALPEDRFQMLFDRLFAQGYRLTDVSAFSIDGESHYASIWEKRKGPRWKARLGLSADRFRKLKASLTDEGYRLVQVSGFAVGRRARYASIWEQRADPPWETRVDLSLSEYQAADKELAAQGYRQVQLNEFQVNGKSRFAVIWEKQHDSSHADADSPQSSAAEPPTAVQAAGNLVRNGGFDDELLHWLALSQTTRSEPAATCRRYSTANLPGKASALVSKDRVKNPQAEAGFLQTLADLPAGRTVQLRGLIKTQDVDGAAAIKLRLRDPASFRGMCQTPPVSGTTDWQPYETSIRIPPNAVGELALVIQGTGQAWFDNIELVAAADGAKLLVNGDFDELTENTPTGWIPVGDGVSRITLTADTAITHGGAASATIINESGKSDPYNWRQEVFGDLHSGATVKLIGWVKTEDATAAMVAVQVLDSEGRFLAFHTTQNQVDFSGTADWRSFELRFTIPPKTDRLAVLAMLAGKGQVWFDDFEMEVEAPEQGKQ